MYLIVQTYSLIELQQLRSELEKRGIRVHVSDEFTFAIPGMPGAEQPRGIWIALPEDIAPARQVVADLIGADRLEPDKPLTVGSQAAPPAESGKELNQGSGSTWPWIAFAAALAMIWVISEQ